MQRIRQFLLNMDAKAWRSLLVSFVLFGGVGLVFLFGAQALGFNSETAVEHWMGASHGAWALPIAIAAFAGLAFLGVPQFVLIAAAVVAFGPWLGFAYSWTGTMVSSLIGFALGRRFGGRLLRDFGGEGVNKFMKMIAKNGFTASLIVRLVPSAPFIVVNMAAGVTPMRMRDFIAGSALGIIPKIALTAFAGHSIVRAINGGGGKSLLMIGAAVVLWIGLGLVARAWVKRREAASEILDQAES